MNDEAHSLHKVDLEHPWLGLESYSDSTRSYFFGRDVEVAELLRRLRLHPLLVLYGRSGLGKTSLLWARLVPELEKLGDRPTLYRISYRAGEEFPLDQLLGALEVLEQLDVPGLALPEDPASRLWLHFHYRKGKNRVTHLILDQFEEIFTIGADWPAADIQVRQALAILTQGAIPPPVEALLDEGEVFIKQFYLDVPPLPILLSVRQDYFFALNRWHNDLPQICQNSFELRALRGLAAVDAVLKPGQLRCHYRGEIRAENKIDTGLPPIVTQEIAERIVRFVAKKSRDVPIEEIEAVPPILSLLCRELNERRFTEPAGTPENPAAQITFREGETDIATIITTFYERCLAGRPEAVRVFIEEEFVSSYSGARLQQDQQSIIKVFTDGREIPGAADGRRAAGYGDPVKARACLEDLVNQRLLTSVGGGENPSYELIHDLLASVVQKSRTIREERFQKEQADRRAETERKAREDAEERRRIERRRARKVVMTVSAALVLAVAAAIYGFVEYGRAEGEKRNAEAATKRATSARNEAQNVMEFMLFDLPEKLDGIGRLDLLDDVNRRTLDYYKSHSNDKDAQRGYSAALRNKGDILYGRGDLPGALDTYEKAFKIIKDVANQDPANVKVEHDLWESGQKIGTVLLDQHKFQDAKKCLDDGLLISEDLTKKDPANLEWQVNLCESYDKVGEALRQNAQYLLDSAERFDSSGDAILSPEKLEEFREKLNKAEELFENSRDVAQRVVDSKPDNSRQYSRARYLVALGFTRRSDVLWNQGDDARALEADKQALSILEKLVEDEPGNADFQRNLSVIYGRQANRLAKKGKKGNYLEVIELYRNALKNFGKLAAQDPTNADWQYQLIWHYYSAAVVMNKMGPKSKAEAREFVEKGKEIKRKLEKIGMTPTQTNGLKPLEEQLP